jgi:murein L,D-transpeptidase YcbB/YkuD
MVAAACLLSLPACGNDKAPVPTAETGRAAVSSPVAVGEEIGGFYRERGFRPIWIGGKRLRPEASRLLDILATADRQGLDPVAYATPELKSAVASASRGDAAALARADLLLSRAFVDYVRDLRRLPEGPKMLFVDPELVPEPPSERAVLDRLVAAPSLAEGLAAATRMNPVFEGLTQGLAARGADSRLVRLNLERARVLPADPPKRFILVDTAGARLWMFEGRRIVGSMRVIVGKPAMQTPEMAGLIRFAVANPYWNVPPDLIRDKVAKHVLKEGLGYIHRERLEVLSDWSASARALDPAKVNWRAVASGQTLVRVRQLPGPGNMMGRVKFMFPNRLGIYLHDTPNKALFAGADRRQSSGCVRLEDAARLQKWLFDGADLPSGGGPELRVDLPEPVPVYITYLTALPTRHGIVAQRDVYGRDAALLARAGSRPVQLSAR